MKIDNWNVYDLEESIVASGLPMKSEYDAELFGKCVRDFEPYPIVSEHMNRACRLAKNAPGTGHANFLSGILVAANVTATNVWWLQMERYHFVQIVSMQSKMHRLREMLDSHSAVFHEKTQDFALEWFDLDDEQLVYSCPMGIELTARITTNYLALKTIYNQRHNHKLAEWHEFCGWIKELPHAEELIFRKEKK